MDIAVDYGAGGDFASNAAHRPSPLSKSPI